MGLEILNAKETPLKDDDVRSIVEIERHPKVREWLTEYVDPDPEKEFQAYRKFFRSLPRNKRVEILIARYDGGVAGFLALWRRGIYMEHVASIGISVHPDYRGKGIAAQLVKSAIALARAKGFKRLEIETLAENTPMRRVAERLGFKLECVRSDRFYKDGSYRDEACYFLLL